MITDTSDSYIIQVKAAILRLCMGCFLCALIFEIHAAHAAQPAAGIFAPGIDLATFNLAHYDTSHPVTDRFSARLGFTDSSSVGFGFGGTTSLPELINLEKLTSWVASIRWHLAAESSRASLSPQLRVETNDTIIEIKQIDRSVWMMWSRAID